MRVCERECIVRVLITGGAGFVGSHLAEHLLSLGDEVLSVDDLSTGSIENLDHLKGRPGFQHRTGNVMDVSAMAEHVDRCDAIVHLAAAVGVRLIVESPVRTIETNIRGTEIILGLAAKKKKLVLIPPRPRFTASPPRFPSAKTTTW